MVHDLNPKNLPINRLDFFAKSKKSLFWGYFWVLSPNEIFSQKSGSDSFSPLRHRNFMRSFRKILRAVLENTRLSTDILTVTVVKSQDPFLPKSGGPKMEHFGE